MLEFLLHLDRRWLFLAMFLAVAIPVLAEPRLPEAPTGVVRAVFDEVEQLPDGSLVFMAMDYDPASRPELGPMASALVRHCGEKRHRLVFLTLWPAGTQMIDEAVELLVREFGEYYVYGENYVNLGFNSALEGAIIGLVENLARTFPNDKFGVPVGNLPMLAGVRTLRDSDLVISLGSGFPGTTEWVQYASSRHPEDIRLVAGVTGVSAPALYPYLPVQLRGMLPAIKGAAEYEWLLGERYPQYQDPKMQEAVARMGPQFVAHVLMIALIVLGNVIFFLQQRAARRR